MEQDFTRTISSRNLLPPLLEWKLDWTSSYNPLRLTASMMATLGLSRHDFARRLGQYRVILGQMQQAN
jgi:hypothetical protein